MKSYLIGPLSWSDQLYSRQKIAKIGCLLSVFTLVHIVNKACIFSIVLHFVGQNGPRLSHFCESKIYFFYLFFLRDNGRDIFLAGMTFFGRNGFQV